MGCGSTSASCLRNLDFEVDRTANFPFRRHRHRKTRDLREKTKTWERDGHVSAKRTAAPGEIKRMRNEEKRVPRWLEIFLTPQDEKQGMI